MSAKPVPDGFHTVTPDLVAKDAARLLDFLQTAFDAQALEKMTSPDGTVDHGSARIGDSIVVTGTHRPGYSPMPATLYLYVPDVDSVYRKALAAGGTSIREVIDEFYGNGVGAVKDSFGNQWWLATNLKDISHEELQRKNEERRGQQHGPE